jgi:glycolate oxidase FAD binding subunit
MSALAELRDRIVEADRLRRVLRIRGGGSKDFYGQAPAGEPLDTRGLAGIVSYEPTELVITAQSGTLLAEVQAVLAGHHQMIAFEPPGFGDTATIGGVIAAGLSGPRRFSCGAARDFVLGASLLTARGDLLRFGGQVMKNVAGYDVSRLLCGSMGILGLITEVSLKVLPIPPAETSVRLSMEQPQSLQRLNQWGGQPLPISGTSWQGGELMIRFSGARAAVDAAVAKFCAEYAAQVVEPESANAWWVAIREHRDAFFDGGEPLWRLSVPSVAPAVELPGRQMIEWGGALRWFKTLADAMTVRESAARIGGTASLFRGGDRSAGVFHPLAGVNLKIHQRLKREFDPNGIFNPGRLYPGL